MKKTEKLNKTRQRMIDKYVKCLKEDKIPWRCGWNQLIAISGSSKKPYRGVNQMLLSYICCFLILQVKKDILIGDGTQWET